MVFFSGSVTTLYALYIKGLTLEYFFSFSLPVSGIPGKWELTKCSKPCGGGVQHKYRKCLPPKFTSAKCYLDNCNKGPHTVPCNTQKCSKI